MAGDALTNWNHMAQEPPAQPPSERRIAHLDMDAFYASVELLRYPELCGQAVVIGGRSVHQPIELPDGSRQYSRLREYVGRGVVTTSTYEARALGVFSAMGTMKAARLAPETILLPANFDAYRRYSRLFKEAVAGVAPDIEDRGIDEIYIDLTSVPGATRELAQRIKQAVRDATGLSCSIGVTPNKFRTRQARWGNDPHSRRSAGAHLAAGGTQDQRHRTQGGRKADCAGHSYHWRSGACQAGVPAKPFWGQHGLVDAPFRQWSGRPASGHPYRNQIGQP